MSPGRAFAIVTVTAFVAGGGLVPAASAATLHVSPHRLLRGSTLLPCAAAQPCNLAFALANAGPGDDVAMAPGDYRAPVLAPFLGQTSYTSTLEVKPGVVLHGDPGATLPVIHSSLAAVAPAVRVKEGGVLRDVAIEATAPAATAPNYAYGVTVFPNALVERSRVRWTGVAGTVGVACSMVGGTVRDSECLGTGQAGTAHALTGTGSGVATYRVSNVTAVTTNPAGVGVRVGTSSYVATMITSNVIARGPAGDLSVRTGLSGGAATMVVDHTNWTTQDVTAATGGTAQLIPGAGNQTGATAAPPLFVDAAAGDYRTAAGSPTIDAGITDPGNGPFALRGAPRTLGAATDIGADEFVPPAPPAPSAPPAPPAPAPTAASGATAAPVLTGLTIARSWSRKAGTTIRFTLSEPATVTLTIRRQVTGRRLGRTCRPATTTNRPRPRCTLSILTGTRTLKAATGENTLPLTGRLAPGTRRALGKHLLSAIATDDSGLRSATRTARFTIRR